MTHRDTMEDLQELVTEYTGNAQHNSFISSPIQTERTFSKKVNLWANLETSSLDLKAKIRPQTGDMSSLTRLQNLI